jgi:hypothetical protein
VASYNSEAAKPIVYQPKTWNSITGEIPLPSPLKRGRQEEFLTRYMNPKHPPLSPLHQKIDAGVKKAIAEAIERHRKLGESS